MSKLILLAFILLSSSSCSFHWKDDQNILQHRGFLWYSLTETSQVRFYEMQTLGLQFRFQPEDSGISLGYRKYIALQPPLDTKKEDNIVSQSGFFSNDDTLSDNATLLFRKQYGLEAGTGLLFNGLSLGYDQSTILEGPSNNVPIIKKIDFYEYSPLSTTVFQSTKGNVP